MLTVLRASVIALAIGTLFTHPTAARTATWNVLTSGQKAALAFPPTPWLPVNTVCSSVQALRRFLADNVGVCDTRHHYGETVRIVSIDRTLEADAAFGHNAVAKIVGKNGWLGYVDAQVLAPIAPSGMRLILNGRPGNSSPRMYPRINATEADLRFNAMHATALENGVAAIVLEQLGEQYKVKILTGRHRDERGWIDGLVFAPEALYHWVNNGR